MKIATPPTSTGNPGQPRDLQFRGPFLEMFSAERSSSLAQSPGNCTFRQGRHHCVPFCRRVNTIRR
jgi:hypothetical protein